LDLGANRGDFSRAVQAQVGGEFRLIEANPRLAAGIPSTAAFAVSNRAVGAAGGTVRLNIAANDEASSVLPLPAASQYGATATGFADVEQVALADVLAEQAGPVDVLKLDIEGAETPALSSLSDSGLCSVAQISVEFHCDPSFGYGGTAEVDSFLARCVALGFCVLDFSAPRKIDVLLLNLEVLRPTIAERLAFRLMPGVIWGRTRVAHIQNWRRTTLGLRPRDAIQRRSRG
jgi:FkbM family methyltransferase